MDYVVLGACLYKFAYTYDNDGNRFMKKYYDRYGDVVAVLNFKGFGSGDAFDASNRLKEVSGNIGTRIDVTGTVSDTGSAIHSVWVTSNNDEVKKVQAEIIDGLWIGRGVELEDKSTNTVQAIAYDDAGNTAATAHQNIALDDEGALYYNAVL